MPSISQLQYIIALDEEKHFGRAAQRCHVAQPSLSSQIQKLEEELDVIIFDRSKKPIIATRTGREIIEQARLVIREHNKIQAIASLGADIPRGPFHLAVIPTLAPYLIPLFIGHFSKHFPQVNLKISEMQTEEIIHSLAEDKIDAALLVTPLGEDSLIERHLFYEPFYAYVSDSHSLHKKRSLAEKDLSAEGLWLLDEGHCFRNQVIKLCALNSRNLNLRNVEFTSGNLETLKNLVKRNSGYTFLPELALLELNGEERKKHIRRLEKPAPTREVSIAYSRSFLKEPVIAAIEASIVKNLPRSIRSLKRQDVEVIDIY